jgi:CBS domain-containing protein
MNVAAILKQKGRAVMTVPPTITLLDAAKKLAHRRVGALVVVGARGELSTRPVAESMTRQVVTCLETDTLDELMALMTARRFRHLPVVTDGDLVGLVSIGDVVKHHVAEIEMEATAMRDYIAHS